MADPRSELIIEKIRTALGAMTTAGGYYYGTTSAAVIRVPFLSDVDFSADYTTEYIIRPADGSNQQVATRSTLESRMGLWITGATQNMSATSNPWVSDGSNPLHETIQRRMVADVKKALYGAGSPNVWSTWGYEISAINVTDEDLEQSKQIERWAYVHMRLEIVYRERIA